MYPCIYFGGKGTKKIWNMQIFSTIPRHWGKWTA